MRKEVEDLMILVNLQQKNIDARYQQESMQQRQQAFM